MQQAVFSYFCSKWQPND